MPFNKEKSNDKIIRYFWVHEGQLDGSLCSAKRANLAIIEAVNDLP